MDVPSEVSETLPADFKHLIVVPLKIGCDSVAVAAVNVSCLPEITGPLIVTLVGSFASVILIPALRALSDEPINNCVELAGVYGESESCFESNASCKVYEVPVASNFISCGAASNHTPPLTLMRCCPSVPRCAAMLSVKIVF